MSSHPLFDLFRTFSPGELDSFSDFLSSPYFNKSANVIRLYNVIIKYYPEFKNERLTKEKIFKAVYNTDYNDSTFRNLTAGLINLAQKFLVIQKMDNDKIFSGNILLNELLNRNQNSLFSRHANKMYHDINLLGVDFQYLYDKHQLERNLFNFSILNDKITNKKNVYSHIGNLTSSNVYLTIYYFTEIISGYLNFIIYAENFNAKDFTNFMDTILEACDIQKIHQYLKGKSDCDFILEIYLSLFYTFTKLQDEDEYFRYKSLVEKYRSRLSADEISFHYSKFVNYCMLKRMYNRNTAFNDELFNLYNTMLQKKLYLNNKVSYLPPGLFRDILFLAIRLEKYEWLKGFIAKYSKKVHPAYSENMHSYGYAFYFSGAGDFDKALDYINKISIDYFIYKYDVKNLRLKIYFELKYFEESLSLIHSYREFLRNNTLLSEIRKTRHRNFLRFLEKLILFKTGSSKHDIEYTKSQLMENNDVTYKTWLLEKYDF